MRPDTVRLRRRLGIVLLVVAGHGAFFWPLAQGLEHRPPPQGPVWMSQVSLPETALPPPPRTENAVPGASPAIGSPAIAAPGPRTRDFGADRCSPADANGQRRRQRHRAQASRQV